MSKDDHGCESYIEWKKQNWITQAKRLPVACTRNVQPNLSVRRLTQKHEHTSIYRRSQHLENSPEQLEEFMQPLVSGIGKPSSPKPQLMTELSRVS